MANSALPVTRLLQEPGFLYWAPIGSATPTNTVANSAYTDTWPVAWIPLGGTDTGTDFTYTSTVQPVTIAELYDPVTYRTTDRTGSFAFALASITASNLVKSFNGATSVVTGSGLTQSTHISPVTVGNEVRAMLGWESFDSTVRIVANQVMNSGAIKLAFNKAPAKATIPWMANFEVPNSGTGTPWDIWTTR
jgi:hypothetical protein